MIHRKEYSGPKHNLSEERKQFECQQNSERKILISDFHVCDVSIVISDLFSSVFLPTPHQQYSNYGIQIGIRFSFLDLKF
jgi:hypothetical protein